VEVFNLKYSIINKNIVTWGLIFFALMLFCGCADGLNSTKKDPFFDKWTTQAENSQGHSPSAEPKKINVADLTAKQSSSLALARSSIKKLPSKEINLTMRQAELKTVLRAMAKSVDLNLMVKNDLKGEVSVDFRGVPWDQAFVGLLRTYGLSYVWEGNIILVKTVEDIEQDLKQKMQLRDIQWVEPLLQPVVVNIDYADPKKLMETLQDLLTKDKDGKPRGSIKVDEHSNSLVISAMSNDLERMLRIIEKLDKPTPQILIKANIVETTKEVARDLGIMWGGMYGTSAGNQSLFITPGGTGGTGSPMSGSYTPTAVGPTGIAGQGFGVNFPAANLASTAAGSLGLIFGTLGGNLLEIQLQALQKDSKLNILSSPSITTLDNQKAFTENGERVPYVTAQTSSGTTTYTTTFIDAVMRLEITPHVIDGKNLKMTIFVQKDDVDISRKDSLGDPYIIKKQTQTVLIVNDGETIVISGLTKKTRSDSDTGWPWLKDIPILGWLFKADSKDDKMEEVLIFITPHILQLGKIDKNAEPAESDITQKNGTVPKQEDAGNKSKSKKDLEPKQ
jgi:type IV pilus assembly protein PilQ